MKKNIYILLLASFTLQYNCTTNESKTQDRVIDVEGSIDNFAIIPLSEFASEIRYVKLETGEESLVSEGVRNIYLEDRKIFILDMDPYLKVFDAQTGKYLHKIGAKGQGPGELPSLTVADIDYINEKILLSWSEFTHEFDYNGNYINRIYHPAIDSTQRVYQNVVMLNEDLFASGVRTYTTNQKDAILIFNRNKEIVNSMKSYKDPIHHHTFIAWGPLDQGGVFYRYDDNIRYFRGLVDTIFSYNKSANKFEPFLSFNFGRHASNHNYSPHTENPDVIIPRGAIKENENTIFLEFFMSKSAPEAFEDKIWRDDGFWSFKNRDVYAVYNKDKSELNYLLQPIPTIRGFKNDIDNGIPFWPKYISSTGEMIDIHQAYQFLEYAEMLPNPSYSFIETLKGISAEDNPVLIIAKPR